MKNKFLNLFSQDLTLNLKILTVVLLAFFYLFLQKGTRLKELEADKLRQDKALLQELERQMAELEAKQEHLLSRAGLVLSGIILHKDVSVAIINGNILKAGDEVAGKKIIEIKEDSVIMNDGHKTFELPLE